MQNSELRIIFFGTPQFVVPVLEALNQNFKVVGVVTAQDKKVGRKQVLTPSPIAKYTQEHSIPLLKLEKSLENLHPDLIVVAAYGHLIPQEILEIPKYGALNIHPSLLPKYRGPSPIQNTILNGDEVTGVTIIKMDEKMDHGPILYTSEITLPEQDNFDTLSKKLFEVGAADLIKIIPEFITGKLEAKEQNHREATFTHIIKKEDGYFDLPEDGQASTEFLEKLDRMIRAYYPWPTTWTKWSPSQPHQRSSGEAKIIKFLPGGLVQMEGKKPAPIKDFLRGYPSFPIRQL